MTLVARLVVKEVTAASLCQSFVQGEKFTSSIAVDNFKQISVQQKLNFKEHV